MNHHAPIHLFDKGQFALEPDESISPRATVELDSHRAELLRQRGWTLVDQWSVYLSPDRHSLVYVNADGTLRAIRPYHPITEGELK